MAEIVEHLHLTDSNELRHIKSEPDIDMRNEEIRRLRYSGVRVKTLGLQVRPGHENNLTHRPKDETHVTPHPM